MNQNEINLLDRAICIASNAHYKQRNKGGEPYIMHLMRVTLKMNSLKEKMVGIMHDLLEDTEWTSEQLFHEGFPDDVVHSLVLLTHHKDESYMDYIKRLSKDHMASKVKIADLEDNSNFLRFPDGDNLNKWISKKVHNYHKAYRFLRYGEPYEE